MATFVDLLPEKELVSVLAEFLQRLESKGKTQTEETKVEGASTIEGKEPVEIVRFFLNHVSLLFKEASEKGQSLELIDLSERGCVETNLPTASSVTFFPDS